MKKQKNEYSYFISTAEIRKFLAVPIEKRLKWIEESTKFFDKVLSPEAKRIRELIRNGEL